MCATTKMEEILSKIWYIKKMDKNDRRDKRRSHFKVASMARMRMLPSMSSILSRKQKALRIKWRCREYSVNSSINVSGETAS